MLGKAFGFHRAGDTAGAIVGPLIGVGLLSYLGPHSSDPSRPFRIAFLLTLIPGLASALTFAILVRENRRQGSPTSLWASVEMLPRPFFRFSRTRIANVRADASPGIRVNRKAIRK